jgi:S1-C subfamily serine protease
VANEVGREAGVEVVEVVEGSPAARAGLRGEDLILDLNGEPVADARDLQRMMVADTIGREVSIRVFRDGQVVTLRAVPAELQG